MKMRNFIVMLLLIFFQHHPVASLSPTEQKTALFQFKQSLTIGASTYCSYYSYFHQYGYIYTPSHPKTMKWSMSTDYCTWEGVSCEHKTGDVVGLDLSCSQLEGAILPNSTLFQLSHLHFLNLSWNDFSHSNHFPQEFGFFAKGLTHLNLSFTGFSGRVPSGISHLYKLVSLDLSDNHDAKLEDEVFKSVLQNLTQLRVLNLYWVSINSLLPMNLSTSLRVLNLRGTGVYGVLLLQKVFHLPNLEVLVLGSIFNLHLSNTSSVLPKNLSSSLRVLDLKYTGVHGVLPQEVFHLPNLEVLALGNSFNPEESALQGVLPKVKWGSSGTLQYLSLRNIDIYGGIPDSTRFLESLASLELTHCNLSGPIPRSIGNLGQLTFLGLDWNNFNGSIPTCSENLTNLRYLSLYYNNFTGPLPTFVSHIKGLVILYLSGNRLTGILPPWLFMYTSLELLDLSSNEFMGRLFEFDYSKSQLQSFSCSNNLLYGPIPQSFSQLVSLTELDFSSNNFSGVLDVKMFLHLQYLDLSYNQIQGKIPHWIGSVGWNSLSYLNISHNRLTGGLDQLPWNNIQYLDLQYNMLNGSLPTLICNSSSLQILNLSNNTLSGVLPICRTNLTRLSVFDLRMNNIEGNIPATLSNFRNLETINLNGNRLEGGIPSSFSEFDKLQVLDLGNNQINDTFPQCLEALPNLQVLVLKSNRFYGLINKSSKIEHPFPRLRIIDLSYNEFSGPLPAMYFQNFKAMMIGDVNKGNVTYMGRQFNVVASHSDSTILLIKGVEIEFDRILTVLTTIDFSRNNFEGEILECIGDLVSHRYLNLSHNHLTGHISSSIGNLSMLESLDLSSNQLEGEIPRQHTSTYSLTRLNMSFNQLKGHIPEGSQFNTFENDSYVGNLGLCGHPLSKNCEIDTGTQEEDDKDDDYFFSGCTSEAVVIGYGCGVVPAFVAGYLMLLAGKPKWFAGIIARELGLKIRRMEIKW